MDTKVNNDSRDGEVMVTNYNELVSFYLENVLPYDTGNADGTKNMFPNRDNVIVKKDDEGEIIAIGIKLDDLKFEKQNIKYCVDADNLEIPAEGMPLRYTSWTIFGLSTENSGFEVFEEFDESFLEDYTDEELEAEKEETLIGGASKEESSPDKEKLDTENFKNFYFPLLGDGKLDCPWVMPHHININLTNEDLIEVFNRFNNIEGLTKLQDGTYTFPFNYAETPLTTSNKRLYKEVVHEGYAISLSEAKKSLHYFIGKRKEWINSGKPKDSMEDVFYFSDEMYNEDDSLALITSFASPEKSQSQNIRFVDEFGIDYKDTKHPILMFGGVPVAANANLPTSDDEDNVYKYLEHDYDSLQSLLGFYSIDRHMEILLGYPGGVSLVDTAELTYCMETLAQRGHGHWPTNSTLLYANPSKPALQKSLYDVYGVHEIANFTPLADEILGKSFKEWSERNVYFTKEGKALTYGKASGNEAVLELSDVNKHCEILNVMHCIDDKNIGYPSNLSFEQRLEMGEDYSYYNAHRHDPMYVRDIANKWVESCEEAVTPAGFNTLFISLLGLKIKK